MRSEKNIILKTGLITLVVLVSVFIIIVSLVSFLVPDKMANFYYEIGFNNISQNLFYRDYKKTGNINSLYSSLSINIEVNNSKKVVTIFDEMRDLEAYNEFVSNYNENILDSNKSALLKGSLYNLDNYLNQKYVSAKLSINSDDLTAFEYSLEKFYNIKDSFDFNNQGVYLFSIFLNDNYIENFSQQFDKEFNEQNIFNEVVTYFTNLNSYIESNFNANVNSGLVVSFANRIIEVGNNIIKVNNYLNELTDSDIEDIEDKIINVKNTYISGI